VFCRPPFFLVSVFVFVWFGGVAVLVVCFFVFLFFFWWFGWWVFVKVEVGLSLKAGLFPPQVERQSYGSIFLLFYVTSCSCPPAPFQSGELDQVLALAPGSHRGLDPSAPPGLFPLVLLFLPL